MRIIAGQWRGRELTAPSGMTTRPTSDRVREALFSSLTSLIGPFGDVRALDAFAGSGALGLESLSRGAQSAIFIECDRSALSALRANVERCGADRRARVISGDAFAVLERPLAGGPVSLLLLDPPYRIDKAQVRGLIAGLVEREMLAGGGVVVWEHASADAVDFPESLTLHSSRAYGSTTVDVAVLSGNEEER